MKIPRSLIAILALLSTSGCIKVSTNPSPQAAVDNSPPTDFSILTSCSDTNTPFTGIITSDGVVQKISGVGNGNYIARAHQLKCVFQKEGTNGTISVKIVVAGEETAPMSSGQGAKGVKGVRAEFLRTASQNSTLITTL